MRRKSVVSTPYLCVISELMTGIGLPLRDVRCDIGEVAEDEGACGYGKQDDCSGLLDRPLSWEGSLIHTRRAGSS